MVSKFYATKNAEELKKVTKSDQNWWIQKQDFVKCLEINHLQSPVVPRAGIKHSACVPQHHNCLSFPDLG